MWVTPSCLQFFGQKYTPFLGHFFTQLLADMADDAPAQAEANLAARAAALKARKPGRPDIDVVVQLEWVNPKKKRNSIQFCKPVEWFRKNSKKCSGC